VWSSPVLFPRVWLYITPVRLVRALCVPGGEQSRQGSSVVQWYRSQVPCTGTGLKLACSGSSGTVWSSPVLFPCPGWRTTTTRVKLSCSGAVYSVEFTRDGPACMVIYYSRVYGHILLLLVCAHQRLLLPHSKGRSVPTHAAHHPPEPSYPPPRPPRSLA